ncbi:transglutaminase family protein [Oscillochloris sp. ZM17-4]|uniref:transglutaminase family protein n=1 Tax=Oscillochloris sp. ZM17-4 TaxID=2866714 RepID=UPI001C73CAA5|nr:transglutaminase family protein [Oscillochloris sp. ZM17-4]MBX0326422.1 transglutaminase family protein [Oscillochloris sp. ZM17-4]
MHELMTGAASQIALINHHEVEWSEVRETRYWMHQRFEYRYPGAIRDLRQRLVVFPPERYGDQHVRAYDLRVSAPDAVTSAITDAFGNRVFTVAIPEVAGDLAFEMRLVVERDVSAVAWPTVAAGEVARYLTPTPLTTADARIIDTARHLVRRHAGEEELADAISTWVYGAMRYGYGATTVSTPAAEALAIGKGLCQDYAHIMLAICRSAGIPARYVSGHMLGEGGSHAWVEALISGPGGYRAVAFDPTNHRRITPAYITVAIGRDYGDVSPTSGSYRAPYQGQFSASKRAGLTHLAYRR